MENHELTRRAEDLWERCGRSGTVTHTGFLSPAERFQLQGWARHSGARLLFAGGWEDAERSAAFFLPDWLEEEQFDPAEYLSAMRLTAFFGDFSRDFVDTGHNDQGDNRHSQNDEYCFEHKKPPHLIDRRLRSDFSQNRENIF